MLSDLLVPLLLGVIEGFTEFLPISSTGHLLIAEHWLGPRTELFNIAVQAGAILAVAMVYRQRLWILAAAVFAPGTAAHAAAHWDQPPRAYLARLVVAFGVTTVLGLAVKAFGWELPHEIAPIGWALILGAAWMVLAEHVAAKRLGQQEDRPSITWIAAILVGVAQVVAGVFPGTSRSAAAIFVVLLCATSNRRAAAEFVFLVGIPTMFGATAYSLVETLGRQAITDIQWVEICAGFVAAFLSASIAVRWLLQYIQVHKFTGFAIYRVALGSLLLLWSYAS